MLLYYVLCNLYNVYCIIIFCPMFFILYYFSCILYPVFCTLYPVSCILYPVSCILYPVSCILYPVSCILYELKLQLIYSLILRDPGVSRKPPFINLLIITPVSIHPTLSKKIALSMTETVRFTAQ